MNLHLLTLGAFAAAVAERAEATLQDHCVEAHAAAEPPHARTAFWPRTDLRVLITGRPSIHLENLMDQSVIDSGVPAVVITLEHPRLRLGPLLGTGGACLSCMRVRRAQHDPNHARIRALATAYEADPSLEPTGYLPHHVRLATSWLGSVLEDLTAGETDRHTGRVRSFHLHTGALTSDRIVGVHGCPRCRRTPALSESTWQHLAADLTKDPQLLTTGALARTSWTDVGVDANV